MIFAAVLPQFVTRSAGQVPAQMLVLAAVFLAIAVVCDSAWAMAAGSARANRHRCGSKRADERG